MLLGDDAAVTAMPINLPDIEEARGRERLQWEKELLGVYTISHPLQQLSIDLNGIVTCSCNELDERYDGKNVMLAGMIAEVRTITTKKGDPMAFVKLEDTQGQCEVVVFPRTYEEFKDKLVPGQRGAGQGQGPEPQRPDQPAGRFDPELRGAGRLRRRGAVPVPEAAARYVGPTINGMAHVINEEPVLYDEDGEEEDDDTADVGPESAGDREAKPVRSTATAANSPAGKGHSVADINDFWMEDAGLPTGEP